MFDDKKYIGYSENIDARKKKHFWKLKNNIHENQYLQNAWNKYGEEKFVFEIIDFFPSNIKLLKLMEIYFIAYYNSFWDDGKGYNLTRGGEGAFWSEDSRKKISILKTGVKASNETRKKQSESHMGIKASEEARKNMSIAKKGKPSGWIPTDDDRKRMSLRMMGFVPSQESIRKTTEGNRGIKKGENPSSIYVGVCFFKPGRNRKWTANVWKNGKQINLKYFYTEEEAAMAYDKKSIELFGENVRLNFPERYVNGVYNVS
jgi:group I intron endonuclease